MRPSLSRKARLTAAIGLSLVCVAAAAQDSMTTAQQPGQMVIGRDQFKLPETVLWDEQQDVYLVSNIDGDPLSADDNGFVSRISPNGEILDLKWIDGASQEVVLHAPKGMIFHDGMLVIADVGGVRFFDRTTGKPVKHVEIPEAYLLNHLAAHRDGSLYVTDSGDEGNEHEGAIYRLQETSAKVLAKGNQLERPNGMYADEQGLLVAPFAEHADTLYRIDMQGQRTDVVQLPAGQLDGLLVLKDGSYLVSSWSSDKVYRVSNGSVEEIGGNMSGPAQIGYDAKRQRVLVPVLKENLVRVIELKR